ncbi:hypothetical protein LC608_08780 [Nostoc sp. XA010]|uniref:hypothetical protein n=1 Tax=Nostoc sp. XA010 TaxID=2780407 RepID=UPI001E301E65|nr:hypothetical protein [Nostoc sp. XA010]MCC5657078.1 hypothetical protein [Nostoc sp. XA010]
MRQLLLYSDQVIPANQQVDEYLLQLLGTTGARIGYISSSSDPKRQYFTVAGYTRVLRLYAGVCQPPTTSSIRLS